MNEVALLALVHLINHFLQTQTRSKLYFYASYVF
jgi:hypothetical protein